MMNLSDPHVVFSIANPMALLGWIWLLVWVFLPDNTRSKTRWLGLAIPGVLALGYVATLVMHWGNSEGGFDSLENVMLLFDAPGATLAGWIHFLCFDLLVGWAIANDGLKHKINRLLLIPCFFLTFMFGPTGLVLYGLIRLFRKIVFPSQATD